ncbi:metal-dependent transcriptional regulator [Demequina sp. NBRC 110051]|uniref:metal-dependent transcriptional regulator n=1 Tax=Demequina sp. NBRC 110051 TaxID=1570340 RepID=UPI000A05263E|nr:metal-dependent transcriptional regulator [Demequina sp. NBRC 110051]
MSDLIDTTEMYLRTIWELIEDGVVPMRARIAEQLEHSGPTVSQTIARMERDGLVVLQPDRSLQLTELGERTAMRVMRKHRLAERLLVDVIGLDLPYVHEEACRWEHVMSDRVERRLVEMLGAPRMSPYGNPIPGLDELGVGEAAEGTAGAPMSLEAAVDAGISQVRVTRIGENPQAAVGFLKDALLVGLIPGETVCVSGTEEGVRVVAESGEITLAWDAARHVFAVADLDFDHD